LLACSGSQQNPEETLGSAQSALIPLEPVATVEPGAPSTRTASCPHHELPDQCGSWAGVELRASRGAGKSFWHGFHHDEGLEDSHCLCEGIDFEIPATLPVSKGRAGWAWDRARLSFRRASGDVVECTYRGNGFPLNRGGGDAYLLERCSRGFKGGQTAHSDWFELELDKGQPHGDPVEISLRLGEPDVVGGAVQEQIFYSDDPAIPGATLHVPRGSAPPFETFSITSLPQVPPGTALQGGAATAVGYAVDIHSDTTPHFVFTAVPGADCPRIELPYDQATLERLVGPGKESQLGANQLLTLSNVDSGSGVLGSAGPVTVNLAQHTLSFCVQHLSFWVATASAFKASISGATIDGPGASNVNLLTIGTPPALTPDGQYTLTLKFKNEGSGQWTTLFKLYAVDKAVYTLPLTPTSVATVNKLVPPTKSPWQETIAPLTGLPAAGSGAGEVTAVVKITAPHDPAPLNFCMADATDALFGLCFSWETKAFGGGSAGVAMAEVCDGKDNNLDGQIDEGLKIAAYVDNDGDGFGTTATDVCPGAAGYAAQGGDCDDGNAAVHPAAYYPDCDGDGHGRNETCDPLGGQESVPITPISPVIGCVARPAPVVIEWYGPTITVNYVESSDDCENRRADVYPGAPETCNYMDNNCDGSIDDEVRDVTYRYDRDYDGWCEAGSLLGCPYFGPVSGTTEAKYCKEYNVPPAFIGTDCNDANREANTFCGEYLRDLSETWTVNGGPLGTVEYKSFHTDCGPGWHITRCDVTRTSTDGNVSIESCPVGAVSGDVIVRFGIKLWTDVSGYGKSYCESDPTYP
jgi:hypothetical protein